MRAGALVVGVFLLVIGVVVFWIGYSDLQQYGGLLGQISQSLSAEVRNTVAQDQFMAVVGRSLKFNPTNSCLYLFWEMLPLSSRH